MVNKNSPIVSVLVTLYNREKYIKDCIVSILNSTYKDYEIVVLDDGSTDQSWCIVEELAKKHPIIRPFRNQSNIGQFANRNKIATLAEGKYLKYLDSDDLIYPHSLEIMVNAMLQHPASAIGLPHTSYTPSTPYPFQLPSAEAYMQHFKGANFLNYGPSASIFKRDTFLSVGSFDDDLGILSDSYLNLKIAAISPITFFQRDLIFWRIHNEQVTVEQSNYSKMAIERFNIIHKAICHENSPLSSTEKEVLISQFKKIYSHHVLRHLFMGKIKIALEIYKLTNLNLIILLKSIIPSKLVQHFRYKSKHY